MTVREVQLTRRQEVLLCIAAGNDGVIYTGDWTDPADLKAALGLVRVGVLSVGSGIRRYGARHITPHGWRVFKDAGLTPTPPPDEED